ncbi:putative bifunctional diguanylate cyclase/phosphodiesterase [Rhodanobacter aciditrophus]|uniref:Bifunctional diguanylate cyclase/phosphodiesterase n=1 Tax=Rhodanobacter aciditrophus TaxID=1623218 RepID=A0ABW4AX69_9GAMM
MSEVVEKIPSHAPKVAWVIDLAQGTVSWSSAEARSVFGASLGADQAGLVCIDRKLQQQLTAFANLPDTPTKTRFYWFMHDQEALPYRCDAVQISLGADRIGFAVQAQPCSPTVALKPSTSVDLPASDLFQSLAFLSFDEQGRKVSFSTLAESCFSGVSNIRELFAVSSAASSFTQRLSESGHLEQEIRLSTQEGVRWYRIEAHMEPQTQCVHMFAQDIQALRDYEVELYRMQNYDSLTQLPNRHLLYQQLAKAQVTAKKRDRMFGILYFDLDGFKVVNDTFGHRVGDQLLQRVSDRIKATIPSRSCLYRLGGDEFVVVTEHVSSIEELEAIARGINSTGVTPYPVSDLEMLITTSIGVACYPMHGTDADALLKNADAAMYRSKEAAHNGYRVYDDFMSDGHRAYMTLGGGLRKAIDEEQFELHYQPKIRLSDELTVGAEALIRWNHPELGMIPPDHFIPIAEESGLILPLGEWVIRRACRQLQEWREQGHAPISLSVNLSSRQFMQPNLVEMVRSVLQETGVDPKYLELELTESMLMADANQTIDKLHAFRAMGLSLSIDDFGTGYSSLAYLKKFPIQTLKIDRSFVQDLGVDADDDAIVKATIAMANSLNLKVIAEGVESLQQKDVLVGYDCEEVQGYFYSRPMSSDDFSHYLTSQRYQAPRLVANIQ